MQTNLYPHPGYLYQITEKGGLDSIIKESMGLKEKEKELYVYFTSQTSTVNPFNNARLKSVLNDADVVVFDTPPEKAKAGQLTEMLQNNYSKETLIRINKSLSESLKSRNVDLIDEKIGDDPRKLALGIEVKILMCLAKNFKVEHTDNQDLSDIKQLSPPESDVKQRIYDKAEESKKVIEYIDPTNVIEKNKQLLFDKGLLEAMLCSILPDKELAKEFMALSKDEQEAWNTGTLKERELDKLAKHPTLVKLEQKFLDEKDNRIDYLINAAKKIKEYFSANKKVLFVLEEDPSIIQRMKPFFAISSSGYEEVNIKGPIKEPTGYFWKIKKNGKTVGYLLGSIHITPNHLHDLNSHIRKCFEKSKRLAVEIDITKKDIAKARVENKIKKWEKLSQLSNAEVENVVSILKKVFPAESAKINFNEAQEKSLFINAAVSKLKSRMYTELNLHSGIDIELIVQAKTGGKPVEDLETLDQYAQQETTKSMLERDEIKDGLLKFLASEEMKNADDPTAIVKAIIEQLSLHLKEGIQPMFDAWEEGNLEHLDHSKTDSTEERMDMTQRNMNMAMKIVKLVNEPGRVNEKLFSCIGAAHTVGEMSVPAFLSNFGLTTERVLV